MESKFGLRKRDSENHWQSCAVEGFKVTKPLIICLSGNGTITELEANGFCKLAESLLEDNSQKVDLMGVAYGNEQLSSKGKLSKNDIDLLVDNILLPLCKNQKTDEILPIDECCKNLSLITFFTFCHGNKEVSNILEKFNERLEGKGLSKENINTLIQSLFEVNYAKETNRVSCPQISVESAQDTSLFEYWYFGEDYNDDEFKGRYAMVCDEPGRFCRKHCPRPEERQYGCITIVANSILKDRSKNDLFSVQSEEHNIGFFKTNNGFHPRLNEEGKALWLAMSLSFKKRVENSILNQSSNYYTRFYLQDLNSVLEKDLPQTNRVKDSQQNQFFSK